MTSLLISCLTNTEAQDLIEYSLLMAFVIVTMAGLILGIGDSVKTITSISNSQINAANDLIH
jgi:Flp pilus assembly pilin Flp